MLDHLSEMSGIVPADDTGLLRFLKEPFSITCRVCRVVRA